MHKVVSLDRCAFERFCSALAAPILTSQPRMHREGLEGREPGSNFVDGVFLLLGILLDASDAVDASTVDAHSWPVCTTHFLDHAHCMGCG